GRREIVFHGGQQLPGHMLVVFLVPQPGKVAPGVFQLTQNLVVESDVTRCPGSALLGAPEVSQPEDQDAAQPASETALVRGVVEVRQFPQNNLQNLLDQIVGVLRLDRVTANPGQEQGSVQAIETLPGSGITGMLPKVVQEAWRSLCHGCFQSE